MAQGKGELKLLFFVFPKPPIDHVSLNGEQVLRLEINDLLYLSFLDRFLDILMH